MTEREEAIMNEAFVIGRIYAKTGEKETPAEIYDKMFEKCKWRANAAQKLRVVPHNTVVSVLEARKKYWHDKARGLLINDETETEEVFDSEDANHMYGVYIDVISDIKNHLDK